MLSIRGSQFVDMKKSRKSWELLNATQRRNVSLKKYRGLTGGGPSDVEELCDWEQKVVSYIGEDLLEGVEGGV